MCFYSLPERKYAVVLAVVLSASLIMCIKMQRNGSPLAFLPGQTGCQSYCNEDTAVFFRINYTVLLCSVLLILILSACDRSKQQSHAAGDRFPLTDLSRLLSVADSRHDFSGKTLVINFWATWCAPCREEMATLQQLSDGIDKKHFLVLGVSVDEDSNLMREFLYQHNIKFANYLDKDKSLAQNILGIRAYPETFIVSPQGVIVHRIAGQQDWNSPSIHSLLQSIHGGEKSVQADVSSVSKMNTAFPLIPGQS